MHRLRLRLSYLVASAISLLLLVVFVVVTTLTLRSLTARFKSLLINQSKSFAVVSTRPIGDAFLFYKDSGLHNLNEQIKRIVESDSVILNTHIVDINGRSLFDLKGSGLQISQQQAASFEPIYETDDQGFINRVVYPFIEESGAHRYTVVYDINSAEIKAALSSIQGGIILAAVTVLVVVDIVMVLLIELLFIRPLKRMSQLAASISAGEYGMIIQTGRRDEIGDLGSALNSMSERLRADIDTLKSAERLKSEFLIISSHNFRTPLTVITGYLDLLSDLPLDDQAREYLRTIETYAAQLTELTNDMLTVAELEGNAKPRVTLEPVDLHDLLTKFVPTIEQRLSAKHQVLQAKLGEGPVKVRAQATYLQTALWNLIDNAIKFTPERGIITLKLDTRGSEAQIIVNDTGIGISQEEQKQLFTKFHRGTSVMQYEYEGIGLGLYMTKLMLDYMNASITLESEQGMGSTFTIHLPLEPHETTPKQINPVGRSGNLRADQVISEPSEKSSSP